jgi:hypothetical protein
MRATFDRRAKASEPRVDPMMSSSKPSNVRPSPCVQLSVARKLVRLARKAVEGGDCGAATLLASLSLKELGAASSRVHRRSLSGRSTCSKAALRATEEAADTVSAALATCKVRQR